MATVVPVKHNNKVIGTATIHEDSTVTMQLEYVSDVMAVMFLTSENEPQAKLPELSVHFNIKKADEDETGG